MFGTRRVCAARELRWRADAGMRLRQQILYKRGMAREVPVRIAHEGVCDGADAGF
jgi:hypothetical protein